MKIGRVTSIIVVVSILIGVGLIINLSFPALTNPQQTRPDSVEGFKVGNGGPGPELIGIEEAPPGPQVPIIPPSPVAFQFDGQDERLEIFSASISLEVEEVRMVTDQIAEIADDLDGVVQ